MLESLSSNPICDTDSPTPSAARRISSSKETEVSQPAEGRGSPRTQVFWLLTQGPSSTMSPPSPRLESGATQMRTLGGWH